VGLELGAIDCIELGFDGGIELGSIDGVGVRFRSSFIPSLFELFIVGTHKVPVHSHPTRILKHKSSFVARTHIIVGLELGAMDGIALELGFDDGIELGSIDGVGVGITEGILLMVGAIDGIKLGFDDGVKLGSDDGVGVGITEGI